jgi:peptide/nickel transport system permease protein
MNSTTVMIRLARFLALPLALAALCPDFLSPAHPDLQDLNQNFAPPSRIHFRDAQGAFHWRPFVYRMELIDLLQGTYREQQEYPYPLRLFCDGYPYRFLGFIPSSIHLLNTTTPGRFHPWGTDDLGRDVLARTLAGARSTLMVLFLGISIYGLLGVAIGALAGMAGGWMDALLRRFCEFVLALPALYLVLAVRAQLPARMPFWQTAVLTAATIAAVAWPPMARGIRGLIRQIQNAGYAEAARALGASPWQVFHRHMLPALAPFVLAQAVVAAPIFILGEVILSFLNVGFQDAAVSWGAMLRNLQDPRVLTDFWWNLAPLGFVFLTLFCLNNLGRQLARRDPSQLA